MRSPRHLWVGYLIAGLAVLGAVGGLSAVALRLEAQAERSRLREARLGRVRIALWRLDSHMTPVLGRIAGHAYSHFVPAFKPAQLYDPQGRPDEGKVLVQPSPILMNDWPDWVVIHFQAPLSGAITSPQVPTGWYQWVGPVAGLRTPGARKEQLSQLERILSPSLRRRLALAVEPQIRLLGNELLAAGGGSAGAGGRSDGWRTRVVRSHGRAGGWRQSSHAAPSPQVAQQQQQTKKAQQRVPEQRWRERNWGNSQVQFTPRANPDSLDNVMLNTAGLPPGAVSNDAGVQKILVPLSPVRSAWIPGVKKGERRLILYRVAEVQGRSLIQGALLDWKRLRGQLSGLVKDLFPRVQLTPSVASSSGDDEHRMTTLPVALAVPRVVARATRAWYRITPVRATLLFAWMLTLLALLATAFVVRRMVEMAERRMNFVNAVSHELRTPLTAFRVHLDLLADGLVTDETKRQSMLEKLRGQSERLTELVRNVLDFARLERKTFVAELQVVEARALLEELTDTCGPRCEVVGLSLEVENGLPEDARIRTDPAAVRQIVSNLVDNACKYGASAEDKRIHLRLRPDGAAVVLEVWDHGPGIPARSRRHLFDPFYRVGQEMTREKPGVGLGLALAKRFSETLGAKLALVGAVREDNTVEAVFALRLPLASG
ncbi:MAG: HAMP domain-containing sensor histidine kinase [bacterium]